MKKTKTLVLGMAFAMLLSACQPAGGGGDDDKKDVIFKLTFHQQTVANDTVVDVIKGKTTNADVKPKEPEIVAREGYTSKWQYDVTSMTADLTIEPIYTAIIYQATYKVEGVEVAKLPFTVEDTKVKNEDKIETGVEQGYKVVWEDYTIGAHNMEVNGTVEAIEYIANFKVDGESIGTVEFSRDDMDAGSTSFPADKLLPIPEDKKEQYFDVYWEDVDLTEIRNVDINLVKEPHQYSAKLVDEDGDEVETLKFHYDKNSTSFVWTSKTPADVEVPARSIDGYDGVWESKTLTGEDCEIAPIYTAHKYTATFVDEETSFSAEREFTVEDEEIANVPDVPVHTGMDGKWEDYEIAAEDLTINAVYELHKYYVNYLDEDEEIVGSVDYNIETASYDDIKDQAPDVPEKSGYTGEWDDGAVELNYSDTPIEVQPKYTANKYKITLPNSEEVEVTYGEAYDLSAKADYFNQLYYGDELMPLKGTYEIAEDIVLTKGPSRFGFEDFESIEAINGLFNTSKSTVSKMTVKDGVGVNGSRGLEVEGFFGDKGIYFSKEYLDMVFARSEIKGLNFDVKGEAECNNFRHKNNAGSNICYFANEAGYGLHKYWTTAQFTREMYEDLKANAEFDGGFVIFGTTGDTDHRKIWVDNLTPVNYDLKASDTSKVHFDNGVITGLGSNDHFVREEYTKVTMLQVFDSNGASKPDASKMEFDTTIKTQGHSSLHIMRDDGELDLGLHNNVVDPAIAAGYEGIEFDIMVDHAVGPGNAKWFTEDPTTHRGTSASTNFTGCELYVPYTWYTLRVPFSHIRDNNMNYFFQLQNGGGDSKQIHELWIDNIHPYNSTLKVGENLIESFENSNVKKVINMVQKETGPELDSVYWEAGSRNYTYPGVDIPVPTKTNYRDCAKGMDVYTNLWFNTSRADLVSASRCAGSIDCEHVSEGTFSFKLEVTHKDGASMVSAFIQKSLMNKLAAGDKVLLDVYANVEGAKFGGRNTGGAKTATNLVKDQWTTVEWEFAAGDTNFFRINEGGLPTGSFWFDNLRVVKAA